MVRNAVEIVTKRPALRLKPVRPSPYLTEHFLQNVFGRLTIAEMLNQVCQQRRRVLPVKDVESIRVSLADLFPKLSLVSQSASPFSYSGFPVKKIIRQQENVAPAPSSHPCGARSEGMFAGKGLRSTLSLQMPIML